MLKTSSKIISQFRYHSVHLSKMQSHSQQWNEFFNKAASEYLKQSAGVTRDISQQVLELLPTIASSSVVHDNACGPGIVTLDILAEASRKGVQPPTIHATDFNEGMVKQIQAVIDEKKFETVTAQVMDGSDLSAFGDEMFTHSITNFGIFMFPDPHAGAKHIYRTLKKNGVAAITVWKQPENMTFANEVIQTLAPGSPEWTPGGVKVKDWLHEAHLRGILENSGFEKEKIEFVEKKTVWAIDDLDETVEIMDGQFWKMAQEGLTEEQKGKWRGVVRENLVKRNGRGLDMVAWVAIATK
jgi:ubiquinone/menaquinone biosynthesis C-methylase UbiE